MRRRALNLRPGENMMHLLRRRVASRWVAYGNDVKARITNPRIVAAWRRFRSARAGE